MDLDRNPASCRRLIQATLTLLASASAVGAAPVYDTILRGGTLYDGTGAEAVQVDLAITGDRIAAVGDLRDADAHQEIDVSGLAVAPGFINTLSWASESLLHDGLSQSDIRQGVTLEVMGEGYSMGPLTRSMKAALRAGQGDIKYDIPWKSLGEYLEHLEHRGVSCNVASFVGATTVREHVLGSFDVAPNHKQLERMKNLVRQAMREGALGVASALIYAPGCYAQTNELVELSRAAGEFHGIYASHLRSEGERWLPAIDELIDISRRAGVPAHIYHFKAAGDANWSKLRVAVRRVEQARAAGLDITADIYPYKAAAMGLDAAMPPWVQEGGYDAWVRRLENPKIRARVEREMLTTSRDWENLYLAAGSPDRIVLVGFRNDELKPLTGKTLAEVADQRGQTAVKTAVNLVMQDGSRVESVYFLMSEENICRKLALPWVSIVSDAASQSADGLFLHSNPHPRAYGAFARVLGRYVRDQQVIPLAEAVRRMTSLPAQTLNLRDRGRLAPGYYADITVFDPDSIQDHATYQAPHQYATGTRHVFVNGRQVLRDGQHTGAKPGRVVRGPGWTGWASEATTGTR